MSDLHDKDEPIVDVSETISKADEIIEKNKKGIITVAVLIGAIFFGVMGFNKIIVAPKEMDAESNIWMAENYFKQDSMNLALNGDGNNLGFYDIIDEYGITKTADLAVYYAGIAELRNKNYEAAIDQLKSFSTEDELLKIIKTGALGDAHYGAGDKDKATSFYRKAADMYPNDLTTPFYLLKLGLCYEEMNLNEDAFESFERLNKEYATSKFGVNAKKHLGRVKQKLGK